MTLEAMLKQVDMSAAHDEINCKDVRYPAHYIYITIHFTIYSIKFT